MHTTFGGWFAYNGRFLQTRTTAHVFLIDGLAMVRNLFVGVLLTCLSTHFSVAFSQGLVPADARLSPLNRVAFTEGPAWHSSGSVFFSDIENNRIMRRDAAGTLHVYRSPSGKANGLVFDLEGRLIACEGGNRRVTRTNPDGSITVLAEGYEGKKFNSPNDVTVDSRGNLYFTDPRYGNRDTVEMLDESGKSIEGVYRIGPDGRVTRLLKHEISRPNGIAVSPDDRYLYVAVNSNDDQGSYRELWRFDFDPARNLVAGSGKKIFDWGSDRGPDGMAVDQSGRLFVTAGLNYAAPPHETAGKYRAGVYVISPEGKLLQTIPVPIDMVTNCTFGGADRKTLFVTAGHKLWSISVKEPGFTQWPKQ
ncbi:SMP-30/gluconolactonase/LRE family protein [Rubripirellula sp.]|nr:SMP-30/gluconolactonase/LRE family protein [Rubripirellula sp.]